nr:MAG TPA: hypothetical protein [Caudoviricetes sp.]
MSFYELLSLNFFSSSLPLSYYLLYLYNILLVTNSQANLKNFF